MKIHEFQLEYILTCIFICESIYAKTLSSRNIKESDAIGSIDRYGSAIKDTGNTQGYRSVTNGQGDEEEEGQSSSGSAMKIPKINTQGTQCYDVASAKRSTDDEAKAANRNQSPVKYKKRRSPYGIVYNQGKPIGILEPISRVYELEDVSSLSEEQKGRTHMKRESETSEASEDGDLSAAAPDGEKYASILTNFKIGHRLSKMKQMNGEADYSQNEDRRKEKSLNKRSIDSSKSSTVRKNLAEIEQNLKQIINDLGLTKENKVLKRDAEANKREVILEDEDLESGMNKIGLTKEMHSVERNKKENKPYEDTSSLNIPKADITTDESNIADDVKSGKVKRSQISDYRTEGENFIRHKRQQNKHSAADNVDIVKGLEASGELTVSGNKSPLASSTDSDSKHESSKEKDEKRDKDAEDADKRVQRNLQNKLDQIKEDVKREIKTLKEQKPALGPSKQAASMQTSESKSKSRKKRNLLEKETEVLNPGKNIEEPQIPHIRKRRDASDTDVESNDEKENRVTWKEMDTGEETTGDLNKREGLTNLERIKKTHNPSNYEFQHRSKRDDSNAQDYADAVDENNEARIRTRDVKTVQKMDEKSLGNKDFWDVQNQNVAKLVDTPASHALVPRNSASENAHVACNKPIQTSIQLNNIVDKNKLERLVSESSSVSKSVKSERGIKDMPNIEIELHTGSNTKSVATKNTPAKREKKKDDDKFSSEQQEVNKEKREAIGTEAEELHNEDSQSEKLTRTTKQNKRLEEQSHKSITAEKDDVKREQPAIVESESKTDNSQSDLNIKLVTEQGNLDSVSNLVSDRSKESVNSVDEQDKVLSKRSINEKEANIGKSEHSGKNTESVQRNNGARLGRSSERQERESLPNVSLEDMQKLDSESSSKRKRRNINYYYAREKRNDYQEPVNTQFKTYRGDDDEADDESDEFDDDNFDDRTANLVRKRAASQDFEDEDYEPLSQGKQHTNKQNAYLRNFVANMNADVDDSRNYLYDSPENRKKRSASADLAGLHSGGPMLRHLAAARERNMVPMDKTQRKKRLEKLNRPIKEQAITDLSEADIFGGLPQSYEGELTRFKRVKRQDDE